MTPAGQISWLGFFRTSRLPGGRRSKTHVLDFEVSLLLVRFAPPANQWHVRRSSPSQLRDSGRFSLPSLIRWLTKLSCSETTR